MKWVPTQLGAEPKKLLILAGLLIAAGVAYWTTTGPSGDAAASVTVKTAPAEPAPLRTLPAPEVDSPIARDTGPMPGKRAGSKGGLNSNRSGQDFRPSMKPPDDFDVSAVDPAIRWELLAKVREVPESGGSRSLFEFSKAPEPPPPPVQPIKPAPVAPVVVAPPVVTKSNEPPKAPTFPPIPLKYYGYANDNHDLAFFLDGDAATGEPFAAAVDQVLKGRYKVIRIGLSSAVLEDTTNKNQQTLPLEKEPPQ